MSEKRAGREFKAGEMRQYRKACKCEGATATTGMYRHDSTEKNDGSATTWTVTFHLGPSCDKCGKPWITPGAPHE